MRGSISCGNIAPNVAEDLHIAAGGVEQPFEDFERRRLARSVGTEQAKALPRLHDQVQAPHRLDGGPAIRAALLLNLAATECRPAGPSAGQKCKWIIDLQRWSAKGLADLL
jgi:hypothetical protein